MTNFKDIGKSLLVLAAIGAVSGGSIAATMALTGPIIEERAIQSLTASLQRVLPDAHEFEPHSTEGTPQNVDYFLGIDEGEIIGFVIRTTRVGYEAGVTVLTAIDREGYITALEVIEHSETPSIGRRLVIDNANFMQQHIGKNPEANLQEIDAISQATITSKAVTNAVGDALSAVRQIIYSHLD